MDHEKLIDIAQEWGVTPEGFEEFSLAAWLVNWDAFVRQVAVAKEALRSLPRVPKARASDSYMLKHVIEHEADTYVSPGATIIAALALGIPVWREGASRNALIGVGLNSASTGKQSPGRVRATGAFCVK